MKLVQDVVAQDILNDREVQPMKKSSENCKKHQII